MNVSKTAKIGLRQRKALPFAILGLVALLSCVPPQAMKGTVKIGLVAPFSGRYYTTGNDMLFAVKLALAEWNSRGGGGSYWVELVALDDQNEADKGALQAKKMIIDPDILGVIGHPSNASALAAAEEYHRANLATIAIGATAEELTEDGYPQAFRLGASDGLVATEVAKFGSVKLGARNIAVIAEPSKSAMRQAELFQKVARGSVTTTLLREQADYHELAQQLATAQPDLVVFFGDFTKGAALLTEIRKAGINTAFLGGPEMATPEFIWIGGTLAGGAYYVSLAPDPHELPQAAKFREDYRALSGAEPRELAALAYDATTLLLAAIEHVIEKGGKPNRTLMLQALADTNYRGITGDISFDDKGNLVHPRVYIYHIDDLHFPGQIVYVGGE